MSGYRQLLLLGGALLLGGCESLAYYGQSIGGQLELMQRSRPIDEILADPALSPQAAERLRLVQRLRRFSIERLGLPDNGSYRSYAALDRRAVVWSVTATPRFEIAPKRWCYLLVGCLSYRGYFDQAAARAEAERLGQQGMDVAVLPVPAYSTLGWFDDPLPSTVIHWPEPELAGLMFHELAHQQVYIPNDTAFNEAYASSVAEQGVALWMADHPADYANWQARKRRVDQVTRLLLDARGRLGEAFAEAGDERDKADRKSAIYAQLAEDYRRLSRDWPSPKPYGHWFAGADGSSINNAHLAQVATYDHWVPAFNRLWQQSGGDPAVFHRAVAEIGALDDEQRHRRLEALMPAAGSE